MRKSGVWLTSLPRLNSLNQEPGFSFSQEVSLAWGHGSTKRKRMEEEEEKQQCYKKRKQDPTEIPHPLSALFSRLLFVL